MLRKPRNGTPNFGFPKRHYGGERNQTDLRKLRYQARREPEAQRGIGISGHEGNIYMVILLFCLVVPEPQKYVE